MKILGVVTFLNVAGAQLALARVLRNLRLRGNEVVLAGCYKRLEMDNGEVRTLALVDKPRLSLKDYAAVPFRMRALLRRERPDAVIAFLPLANVITMPIAWAMGISPRIASQRIPSQTAGRLMRLADRVLGSIGAYTEIICVSQAVADSFSTYPQSYRKRLRVVHNGIDWQTSDLDRATSRKSFGVAPGAFVLAAVGRLLPQKNFDTLLQALVGLDGVECIIAGEGDLLPALEARARELGVEKAVRFAGSLPASRIADLLVAADVFIQPSRFEGMSNAFLEAMHQGLPSIVGDLPEQRETAIGDRPGEIAAIFCDVDRTTDWHDAIVRLKSDDDLRRQLGASAAEIATRRFSLKQMIDGFEAGLEQGRETP